MGNGTGTSDKNVFRTLRGLRSLSVGAGALALAASLAVGGCGDDEVPPGVTPPTDDGGSDAPQGDGSVPNQPTRFSRPSHGSTADISEDDSILVAVNSDLGTVSIFDVTYAAGAAPTLTKKADVKVDGEPAQVALTPDGNRAFVVLRKDQKLVRIDNIRTTPAKGPEAKVGSEPTSVALTPRAKSAWVSN